MPMPNPDFWRDKQVLVTGHTGFKGSWLATWLLKLGARVQGLALDPPTDPSLFDALGLANRLSADIHQDINDAEALSQQIQDLKPDVVFHMAAQSLVRPSYDDPLDTFQTNVMGTAHVLEAIRHCDSVKSAVIVTTDKVYDNPESGEAFSESDPLGGHDPYSASKAASEVVFKSFLKSFIAADPAANRLHMATARAGNVIGGGDWAVDRLVPDCLRAFEQLEAVTLRYPEAVRPWQHVLAPLHGYLLLAEKLNGPKASDFEGAWNFSPSDDDTVPVRRVAERLANLWGNGATVHCDNRDDHPHEAGLLKLDSSLARDKLNWNPSLELDQALGLIVAWTQAWTGGADMFAETQGQIAQYEAGLEP